MLTNPLRDRFGIVQRLEFYSTADLATIVSRSAGILGLPLDPEGAFEIARRARGTPRIANRLLRRVRDFAEVRAKGHITKPVADLALNLLDVDEHGFDHQDRRLLLTMIEKFDGGPVGVDSLAAAISEERHTIEDVLEPYLIQQGYIMRTSAGQGGYPACLFALWAKHSVTIGRDARGRRIPRCSGRLKRLCSSIYSRFVLS